MIHFTSPAGWLPVHRDQLRAQRSVTSMGKLYLYLYRGRLSRPHLHCRADAVALTRVYQCRAAETSVPSAPYQLDTPLSFVLRRPCVWYVGHGRDVIVRPLSTVEYTSIASLFHCRQWSNLIHDRCRYWQQQNSQRLSYLGCSRLAGCVHSSVNKPGANGRVSYNTLTHSTLYCRDREKK